MKTLLTLTFTVALFLTASAQQPDNTVRYNGLLLSPAWVPGNTSSSRSPGPPAVQACLQNRCAGSLLATRGQFANVIGESGRTFRVEAIATDLDTVWDMLWAPDGQMWITERNGRISRIHLQTGAVSVLGQVLVEERAEAGLLGMALHPEFSTSPWVYVVGTFKGKNRLLRMRYDGEKLGSPEVLLDSIPGNTNHNGSRLVFGPDRFLYVSMGEAGSQDKAQDTRSLSGKILRLTAEGKPAPGNPYGNEVWSLGHRNPQGLAFHPATGVLYSSEHGQRTDDEINIIEKGRNYGWPKVLGACDEGGERKFCQEKNVAEPVTSFTPPIAPSGAAFYSGSLFGDWDGNLLVAALGRTSLFRIALTPDGRRSAAVEQLFHYHFGRLRDVLVGPDGAIYLATSNRDGHFLGLGLFEGDDKILRVTPLR